jgi:hypothetical protein
MRRSHKGLIQPWLTRYLYRVHTDKQAHWDTLQLENIFFKLCKATAYLICSWVPPDVAFEIAHADSFLMSNSAFWSRCTSGPIRLASITAWNISWISCRKPSPHPDWINAIEETNVTNKCIWFTWICSLFPAVILEMVQQASFLMLFL